MDSGQHTLPIINIPIFTYSPILQHANYPTIRILELHTGDASCPIQCSLRSEVLTAGLRYEALSYCWGSVPSEPDSPEWNLILCNGAGLKVTTNLFFGLARLRRPHESRRLWVDAICIDQSNTSEKSQQVRLMGRIYRSASSVAVWLGEECDNSHLLEAFIPELLAAKRAKLRANDERTLFELCAGGGGESGRYGLPLPFFSGAARWHALCRITARPWFSRAWIVQEISLAHAAAVYCGRWSLPWDVFVEAVMFTQNIAHDMFHGLMESQAVQMLSWSRTAVERGTRQSLVALLIRHRGARTSVEKDKVYALCGLATDGDIVQVDYSGQRSWQDVYRDTTAEILEHSQNLDVLSAAHVHVDGTDESPDLPSWVPNWTIPKEVNFPLLMSLGADANDTLAFRATGTSVCRPSFNKDRTTLSLYGMIADEIADCGPVLPLQSNYDLKSLVNSMKTAMGPITEEGILHNWERVAGARSAALYPTGEPILDAYHLTLCAMPPGGSTEELKRIASQFDKDTRAGRWLNSFFIDSLGLNHTGLAFRVLTLVTSMFQVLGRLLGRLWGEPVPDSTFKAMMLGSVGRKMIRTKGGYIGLGTPYVRKGDFVGLLPGSKVPLAVRKAGLHWQLLGESYVYGIMNGEAFQEEKCVEMVFC